MANLEQLGWLLLGVITWYAGPYVGEERYCGGRYEVGAEPWVALPVSLEGTFWECGDLIYLRGEDWSLLARAMDAGPLGRYNVEGRPIVADVPGYAAPWEGLSAEGEVWNLTAMGRAWETCRDDPGAAACDFWAGGWNWESLRASGRAV